MFENLQDTCLLHNTVLSVLNQINSSQETEPNWLPVLENNHEAAYVEPPSDSDSENLKEPEKKLSEMEGANLVASLVYALAQKRVKNPMLYDKILEEQCYINRRCHAAMFHVALKSNGITCAQATSYFESVGCVFPPISWKFYIMLCFHCEWSEYFVECAVQFESYILVTVVKNILKIEWAYEHLRYYSWHMVLQAIIWKSFMIEDPTSYSFPNSISFSYPFVDTNSRPETGNQVLEHNCSLNPFFNTYILHHLSSLCNCGADISYCNKIILHAYKTIFKLLRKLKTSEKNIVRDLFALNPLLECCLEKISQDIIKSYKKENIFLTHYYSNASWKISEDYLLFIVCSYWNDALRIVSDADTTASLVHDFPLNKEKSRLISICSFYADQFEENDNFVADCLKKIIIYNYPCAANAAVVLLHHPKIREKEEILQILEEKASVWKPHIIYPKLIDVIVETESKEIRIRFLKVLHLILSQATCTFSVSIYNDVLKYIHLKHDMRDHFMLDNFEDELAVFSRKTMSLREAKKCLLPLFIQSPTIILSTLIEQALVYGSKGMDVIQVLSLIPEACLYNGSLVTELEYYFSKEKLEIYEEKNLSKLIQSLMEIQAKESLLDLNEFIQKCIVENDFTQISRLQVNYMCLIVALEVLTNKIDFILSKEVFQSLLNKICSLINTSIQLANGKIKAIAIDALLPLEKVMRDVQELELDFSLYPSSSILQVYTSQLFNKESCEDIPGAPNELCDSLWTWCCHFKDATPFQEIILMKIIPYDSLLGVIISVLPHCTKDEWLESTHLIEEYFKYVDPAAIPCDMEWLLPQTDRQLYNVIRCLMDCYICILKDAQHYTTACFTNTVMDLLKQKASPDLYLNIFLDTCHLISVTNTLTLHLSFLINIKKEFIEKLKDKLSKQFYNKIMYYGIKNLPDYEEKNHVLQQFQ